MNGNKCFRALIICLLVFFSFSLAVTGQSKKDKSQAKDLLDQGDKSFTQKNYRDAVDKYAKAILLVPTNPPAHYWKAASHYYLKEYDPAKYEFQLALNQGFKPIEVYRIRWFLFFDLREYDAALADLNNALAIEPRNPTFLNGVGEIYAAKNQFPEALAAYQKGVAVSPKDGDLYYNVARVQAAMGNVKAQRESADDAIKNGTRMTGEAYYLLADAARKQKDFPAAIAAYQRAISSKPGDYDSYKSLADIYRSQGRFTDAIDILKKALLQFPTDGSIYSDLSRYYSLVNRPQDGVQAAQAAIKFQPAQFAGYTNLCRSYNEVKQYPEAVAACNSALKLNAGDGETYYYLANAYVGQGKSVEATEKYTKAVAGLVEYTTKNPGYPDGWYLLGNALFADKQYDRAIDAYLKCLTLSPNFLKARVNLGIGYTRKKNKAGAMEQYNILQSADAALAARLKAEIDKM